MTLELNAAIKGLVKRASDWTAFDEMYEKQQELRMMQIIRAGMHYKQ